ncbi:MAG: PAS domain-containing protein [Gammaproteobacteria bacterium]|nr:PAS domain-containing protein [Gammaproteobacteria bacterium]
MSRLKSLSDNMEAIAGGNLQKHISDTGYDEIAGMARALEVFRKTAIELEQYHHAELNEARLQLNNAIESISEGFCLFDKDDRLVLQNNHYRELFGLDDSHLGNSFETLLRRAMESRIQIDQDLDQYFTRRLAHHQNPTGPFVQQLQNGGWIRITERKTESLGTVAIYSDITEIKQHEQALDQAIQERDKTLGNLEAVMDAIDYGILFLDRDLNISSVNRAYHQIWEIDAEEINKVSSYREIINLNYGDSVVDPSDDHWHQYVEDRITEITRGSINRHEVNTRKGKTILHQCVALANGSRMLAYFDITQLKQVEAALRHSRERYALALRGANEALWEWVPEDNEVYVSKRFHEIADIPAEQERLTEEQWIGLVHADDIDRVRQDMIRHMKDKDEFFDVEYRLLGPDKVYRWIQHRGAGLRREDGWIYRMAGSIGEIEARKNLQFALMDAKDAAEQNSRFKSQFIANMSHELRTPLNAIIGITEMLREDVEEEGPDSFQEPLTRVSRAGKHLLNLINDVLDLSRIEAGKLALFPEHVEIETLVSDAITTTQHLIQRNSNRIHLEISDEVKSIYSDPLRFRQIVLNLLTNASKFTQNGDIYVSAHQITIDRDSDWLEFSVRDTGIGIDEEFLEKLFVEFAQEDSSATRRFGGTGLGLTICQRLCDMMGGEIEVESTVGIGTKFTVYLPAIPGRYPQASVNVSRVN